MFYRDFPRRKVPEVPEVPRWRCPDGGTSGTSGTHHEHYRASGRPHVFSRSVYIQIPGHKENPRPKSRVDKL